MVGQHAGCEAAVHAMGSLYDSQTTETILLVDANNAFNSLYREVALRNIQHLCPSLSVDLINTYREDIDGATLLSTEGTTQGDPLAMAMYGIGILPLIKKLQTCDVTQAWYADDAAAAGSTANIRCRWDIITKGVPMFGYYPNASKTHLIVKQEYVQSAKDLFEGTGITVIADGDRYLATLNSMLKTKSLNLLAR